MQDVNRGRSLRMASVALVIVNLVLAGLFVFLGASGADAFEATHLENEVYITDLKAELAELTAKTGDERVEVVDMTKKLQECTDLGNQVAAYQNKYYDLAKKPDTDETKETDLKLNVINLRKCFKDGQNKAGNAWYSANPDVIDWKWTFESVYNFTSGMADVLWLCESPETGELLAFATAKYSMADNDFRGLQIDLTTYGSTYAGMVSKDDFMDEDEMNGNFTEPTEIAEPTEEDPDGWHEVAKEPIA